MGVRPLITATIEPARSTSLALSPWGSLGSLQPEDQLVDLRPEAVVEPLAVEGVIELLVVGEEQPGVTGTSESVQPVGFIELVVSATCNPSIPAARVDQGRLE